MERLLNVKVIYLAAVTSNKDNTGVQSQMSNQPQASVMRDTIVSVSNQFASFINQTTSKTSLSLMICLRL